MFLPVTLTLLNNVIVSSAAESISYTRRNDFGDAEDFSRFIDQVWGVIEVYTWQKRKKSSL